MRETLKRRVEALEARTDTRQTEIVCGFGLSDAEIARRVREAEGTGLVRRKVTVFRWLPTETIVDA